MESQVGACAKFTSLHDQSNGQESDFATVSEDADVFDPVPQAESGVSIASTSCIIVPDVPLDSAPASEPLATPALLRAFDQELARTPWIDFVSMDRDLIKEQITQAPNEEKRDAWMIILHLTTIHLRAEPPSDILEDLTVSVVKHFHHFMHVMKFRTLAKVIAKDGLGWMDLVDLSHHQLLALEGVSPRCIDRLTRILGHTKDAMRASGISSTVVCLHLPLRPEMLNIVQESSTRPSSEVIGRTGGVPLRRNLLSVVSHRLFPSTSAELLDEGT